MSSTLRRALSRHAALRGSGLPSRRLASSAPSGSPTAASADIALEHPIRTLTQPIQPPTSRAAIIRRSVFRRSWIWHYIILLALVGSQNINVMRQKQEYNETKRRYARKIDVLERVIGKIKSGDYDREHGVDVDVDEQLRNAELDIQNELGSGVAGEEEEWRELMESLEEQELEYRTVRDEIRDRQTKASSAKATATVPDVEDAAIVEQSAAVTEPKTAGEVPKKLFL
ncbi:uncharacterized protein V1518DRAFT_418505 [Limtongia smithiae]|uniref:uncharacterized protein n=1 Tax=Limtongia smithiae TaxID=1125753 RepID=UPI0034CF5F95